MKLLKLCNIKNIQEARTAGSLGIPFLGFHLISENDFQRYDEIKKCIKELRSYYPKTKAILVTKETNHKKLFKIINDVEVDGVQLHYFDSSIVASKLKSRYGDKFIVIQVVSPESKNFNIDFSDYLILDKSYVGGTGKRISFNEVENKLNELKSKEILLAGGVSHSNIYQYTSLPIAGLDIQSAIKSEKSNNTENTDYLKIVSLANLLGYKTSTFGGLVGFAVQDIKQENQELYLEAIKNSVDFFHIDISDGFVGKNTNLIQIKKLINLIRKTNSHIKIQAHFFISSQASYDSLKKELDLDKYSNVEVFIHINRDNYLNFESNFVKGEKVFFSLDVKDVIDELYPWEQFIKSQLLICLQSKNHDDRIQNLNRALKLVRYSTKKQLTITLDRSVDNKVVFFLDNVKLTNVVCGTYLRENMHDHYQLLKELINVKS